MGESNWLDILFYGAMAAIFFEAILPGSIKVAWEMVWRPSMAILSVIFVVTGFAYWHAWEKRSINRKLAEESAQKRRNHAAINAYSQWTPAPTGRAIPITMPERFRRENEAQERTSTSWTSEQEKFFASFGAKGPNLGARRQGEE